ncbi:hypothetical protein Hanom_Chr04g00375181 [Helianthus anomalus]
MTKLLNTNEVKLDTIVSCMHNYSSLNQSSNEIIKRTIQSFFMYLCQLEGQFDHIK